MSQTRTVTSPFSGETIGQVPLADEQAVELALTKAHKLYRNRKAWLAVHQRVEILENTVTLLLKKKDELAIAAASEGGKPLPDSIVEINRGIDGFRICIEHIRADAGNVIPMGGTAASAHRAAFTQKEPIGVVVAVSAFNHPFNLIVHQVCAAIAAGCPVIVKPSQETPLSCMTIVKTLHEAGLDPDWCQFVLPENRKLSEKMVTDSRVGFFSFIGSAAVGWMLKSKLAPGTRCALEHGGVAPVIVAKDTNLDKTVPALAKGGFYHAGQVCVSVQRIYADESIARELAERIAQAGDKMVVGDPTKPDTEVGPLITPKEAERVAQWVEEAKQAGAEIISGGKALDNNCYAPTVIFNPPTDAKVSQNEVFGPVVCVYPFSDMEQAIQSANSLPVSFQAAVFTQSIDTAMFAYRHLDASAVMLNDHTAFRVDGMPFAGLRESGHGVGGIPHTIEDMQIEKMLVIHSSELI
jgi:acyl-CoA reductase-like NAD-dependent aldehyde dehydrogenase